MLPFGTHAGVGHTCGQQVTLGRCTPTHLGRCEGKQGLSCCRRQLLQLPACAGLGFSPGSTQRCARLLCPRTGRHNMLSALPPPPMPLGVPNFNPLTAKCVGWPACGATVSNSLGRRPTLARHVHGPATHH